MYLYKIILVGSKTDTTITSDLLKLFSGYGSAILLGDGKLKEFCTNDMSESFVLYDTDSLYKCNTENTIIIIKDQVNPDNIIFDKIKCPVIVSSANTAVIKRLEDSGNIRFWTCGMNSRDTVSYSSITDESIVCNLQKKVVRLNSRDAQIMEIPVRTQNINAYYIMAFFACMIFCDMEIKLI